MAEECRVCDGEVRMIAYRGTGLCSGGCAEREAAQIALDQAERTRLADAERRHLHQVAGTSDLEARLRADWTP